MSTLIENDNAPFAKLPFKLLTDKNISAGAIRVYAYLRFRASQPGHWEFKNNDIKNMLDISTDKTIGRYLKELRKSNWIERKKHPITNYFTYIINADNDYSTGTRYNELEERVIQSPQALYLMCQNLLDGFSFTMYQSYLLQDVDPTLTIQIEMDANGYFYDIEKEIEFNATNGKIVWQYLWQERLNEVISFIKRHRR